MSYFLSLPIRQRGGANKRLTTAIYFQAIYGDSAVEAGLKLLPLFISCVITSVASGGLVTLIGYYNPVVLPCMLLFAVGSGLITTFGIDSPLRVWFGYQVVAGMYHPVPLIFVLSLQRRKLG